MQAKLSMLNAKMYYMNKLLHHFWFKPVFVSSFSFQPVKSFSSEKHLVSDKISGNQ